MQKEDMTHMNTKQAADLLAESMQAVFGFCLSRIGHREEAEDVAGEILCRVLAASAGIQSEGQFYGYLWQTARHRVADHRNACRKKHLYEISEDAAYDIADNSPTPEETVITDMCAREEIGRLRMELSLLSARYREATVLYYMEHLSCKEIAKQLHVSTDTVKFCLFRARKRISEGIQMERILGEKSYHPQDIAIDFWGTVGGESTEYRAFRERKIKGNILAAAYYAPMTVEELSLELGVAAPYLEDEIRLLLARRYLAARGGKYRTNIPVFMEECTREIDGRIARETAETVRAVENVAEGLTGALSMLPENENLRRWQLLTLCCAAWLAREEGEERLTTVYDPDAPYAPVNGGGGCGVVWGYAAHPTLKTAEMRGISHHQPTADGRAYITAVNFAQLAAHQAVGKCAIDCIGAIARGAGDCLDAPIRQAYEAYGFLCDGVCRFPVYTPAQKAAIDTALAPLYRVTDGYFSRVADIAAAVTADHAPEAIRDTARRVGKFVYVIRGFEILGDALWNAGWLKAPCVPYKPAMFVELL